MAFDVKEIPVLSPRVGGGLMCFGFFLYTQQFYSTSTPVKQLNTIWKKKKKKKNKMAGHFKVLLSSSHYTTGLVYSV